ncbi:MAG: hypothetical protein R6X32_15135 [Chloroflexota bacterium]|jgi:hypothetical protein
MFEKPPRYYTFILRFWEEREGANAAATWRYSLHDPENDVRYGFTSLEELTAFLQKRSTPADADPPPPAT